MEGRNHTTRDNFPQRGTLERCRRAFYFFTTCEQWKKWTKSSKTAKRSSQHHWHSRPYRIAADTATIQVSTIVSWELTTMVSVLPKPADTARSDTKLSRLGKESPSRSQVSELGKWRKSTECSRRAESVLVFVRSVWKTSRTRKHYKTCVANTATTGKNTLPKAGDSTSGGI